MKARLRSLADVKSGMTIFIGLLIFMFLLFAVGTEQNVFTSTYRLNLFVTDVKGIAEGSMVTLGGLKIGRVETMEFAARDGVDGILIPLIVRREYQHSITEHSTAVIKTIGMLGDKYVDISIGRGGKPIEENGILAQRTTFDLSEASDSVQAALNRFTGIITDIGAITRRVSGGGGIAGRLLMDTALARDLESSVHALREITGAITEKKGAFGRFVYDERLYAQLTRTADNLRSLTDSVRSGSGSLGRLLRDDSLYASMHRVALSLNTVFARASSDSASSVGSMLNSDELYRDMTELVSGLNALIEEIKTNPKKFFHISVF